MALETGTYINSLVATNPAATDGLAQADDHLRLLKSTIKATFPSLTGAVNATHTELNTVADGGTAATSTTLVDADRIVVNDDGTMVQVALTDLRTYLGSNLAVTSSMITDGTITGTDIAAGTITAANLATGAAFVSGMIMPYAGTSDPTGWLMCYGQAIDQTTYADLYAAIGGTYGSSGSNFNVPDLRGRVIAGQDDMGGSSANRLTSPINGDTLGAAGGSQSHTLTEAQMPAHSHKLFNSTARSGSPSVPTSSTSVTYRNQHPYSAGGEIFSYLMSSQTGSATIGVSSSVGSGSSHPNVQPTIILNYIIKT